MTHLLLGIKATYIRREPYIPTVAEFPILKAGEIGLKAAFYAGVFIMPGPASYVGGDIVSGVLYTGFNHLEDITLNPQTFEPEYQVIGNFKPRGICGSGMIDLLSEMLLKKVIGQDGKFKMEIDHPRLILFNDEPAFVIEYAKNIDSDEDIIFTESDIKSLILSKAAVYAGFSILIEQIGMDFSSISKMIITGGFGQFLDIEKAITIGLLPDIDRDKFQYMGNSSIAGAYMALLSNTYRQQAISISNAMTYIDFSSNNAFMDEFTRAQFLPHTDANLFPSVLIDRN